MSSRGSRNKARVPRLAAPRVVVGLDFGTTFSGFAYGLNSPNPSNLLRVFYEWPEQKEAHTPYCKTTTSSYYLPRATHGQWKLKNWGWPAKIRHSKTLGKEDAIADVNRSVSSLNIGSPSYRNSDEPRVGSPTKGVGRERDSGVLVTHFKLLLCEDRSGQSPLADTLPEGLELERVISDYLAQMGQFALRDIQKTFGAHLDMSDLQWVITVPSIWDEKAKRTMKRCMERANLVQPRGRVDSNGGSRHELLLIFEPEAGSIYCRTPENWPKDVEPLSSNDRFVVVDAGGGTVDLVGQVEDEEGRTREIARSSGNLCGGKFVDDNFVKLLGEVIPILREFVADRPSTMVGLMKQWFIIKNKFSGEPHDASIINISSRLAAAWEKHIEKHGLEERETDELLLTSQDIRRIFDPIVGHIIELIRKQVRAVPGCKAILMVGGFSESKYLQKRVKDSFGPLPVVIPEVSGSAICVGATMFGMRPNQVASRIARKTYGIGVNNVSLKPSPLFFMAGIGPPFLPDIDEDSFLTFVNKGEEIEVDSHVTHTVQPSHPGQKEGLVELFSSEDVDVESTTEWGVKREGKFTFLMPDTSKGLERELEIQMYFGRSCLEVTAKPLNFRQGRHEDGSMSIDFDGADVK